MTRQATWLARWQAADLYLKDIVALRSELSLSASHASDELRARVGDAHEPYRALLAEVRDRLEATRDLAEEALAESAPKLTGIAPYLAAAELAEPLELCFRSLVSTGNEVMAAGRLTDILRRVTTFGVTLARLDLRQEAERHTAAVDWIAQAAGLGRYAALSEPDRQRLLVQHLAAGDVRLDDLPTDDVRRSTCATCSTRSASLRASIRSRWARMSSRWRARRQTCSPSSFSRWRRAPRTRSASCRSSRRRAISSMRARIMSDLLAIPWYRDRINGHQEVMIGYSDSAKDAGRMSADWALYCAQEEVVAACEKSGVRLTLFHGRGGSIGRGGGPTYLAIQSQPPGSIRGTLRATEQGEMMQAKFGLVDIAIRTLEVYTTATLEAAVAPQPSPKPEWRACMDQVAGRARATYRSVVYEDPRFIPYFRTATPEPELTQVSIGSRPARRTPGKGVESLRAIPWQFAWTQTRLMLPSWLGIEDALSDDHNGMLREMYSRWAFFASTIDLVEMTLAKADGRIAAQYDRLAPEELRPLGLDLRNRLARAVDAVLAVTGHDVLLEANPVLRRSIDVRNPYVDPINLVQVELLRRLRGPDPDPALFDAFVVTVNGIAAGMRNTGESARLDAESQRRRGKLTDTTTSKSAKTR